MKKIPRISEAEWQVMKVLWDQSPRTTYEIVAILSKTTNWKRETIRTLTNRLIQKKAVGYEPQGSRYHYYPLVSESECIRAETESFAERFEGDSMVPMLAAFVEHAKLSATQIERLKQILEGKRPTRKQR